MQRIKKTFAIAQGQCIILKQKMLKWCEPFSIFAFLDSNGFEDKYGRFDCLLGANLFNDQVYHSLDAAIAYQAEHKEWLLGHISYDYKNELEQGLSSGHECSIDFGHLFFFVPAIVCSIDKEQSELTIETFTEEPDVIYQQIVNLDIDNMSPVPEVVFEQRTTREQYLATVERLRQHIKKGDCYEINYCNERYAEGVHLSPVSTFFALNNISKAPFAACYRKDDKYMMCSSPERYLAKRGAIVLSQPIKGTARRGTTPEEDEQIKAELRSNIKEQAENVMITDLVRNDLARSCKVGSVWVEELFGIYSFPQVHQMISTVSGKLKSTNSSVDAIRYSFPMGSMTGAPKFKVMQLIDGYEDVARGLFSGSVGYFSPDGDFDFNVIIRSLFYDKSKQLLTYQTGGAITYDSVPQLEWEEMRLKAWALERIFMKTADL